MNRRRLLFLCTTFVLIGVVIAAWFVLANRDADFHVIGPKTRGVRANLAMLDSKIDTADFQDCKTFGEALKRLNQKLRNSDKDNFEPPWIWTLGPAIQLDFDGFVLHGKDATPFQCSRESQPISVKQFLRDAIRQTGVKDAHFIVRGYCVEATTLERVQLEQTRYLDSVSLFDRVRNAWKEMTGQIEDDAIEIEISQRELK